MDWSNPMLWHEHPNTSINCGLLCNWQISSGKQSCYTCCSKEFFCLLILTERERKSHQLIYKGHDLLFPEALQRSWSGMDPVLGLVNVRLQMTGFISPLLIDCKTVTMVESVHCMIWWMGSDSSVVRALANCFSRGIVSCFLGASI